MRGRCRESEPGRRRPLTPPSHPALFPRGKREARASTAEQVPAQRKERSMPPSKRSARSKQKACVEKEFTKRRSVDAGMALADAAHAAVWRLYCEVFAFWRGCRVKKCRRHRRCVGEPAP